MTFDIQTLITTKTFWLGAGLVAAGITMIANGETEAGTQKCIEGLALIFVREAIKKQ